MIRPTQARIDCRTLHHNIDVIRSSMKPEVELMAVVKADCYGHGMEICVPAFREIGIRVFGAATLEEIATLRRLGVKERIVLLYPLPLKQMAEAAALNAEFFVSNVATVEALAAMGSSAGRPIQIHLFVDTGLGRDGERPEAVMETLQRARELDGVEVRGLASHFATSDETDNPFVQEQLQTFEAVRRRTIDAGFLIPDVHIANSGGVLNFPESHYSMVRPGLALYGYHPTMERHEGCGLQPVMTLRTEVVGLAELPANQSISYGRRYYTGSATTIATLPIGYADGLFRSLTNRLSVTIRGKRYPVVGTICMDEVLVDLGPNADVTLGDEAVVFGASPPADRDAWDLADTIGTIPYEICTGVSKRVPRIAV